MNFQTSNKFEEEKIQVETDKTIEIYDTPEKLSRIEETDENVRIKFT